jgi:hypothetical protein
MLLLLPDFHMLCVYHDSQCKDVFTALAYIFSHEFTVEMTRKIKYLSDYIRRRSCFRKISEVLRSQGLEY